LLDRAARAGYTTLALTDTNNLYGAPAFVDADRGVRPLLGATLRQGDTRAVALIESPAGYTSLCRILSRLHLHAGVGGLPPEEQSDGTLLRTLLVEQNAGLQILVEDVPLAEQLRDTYGKRLWFEIVRPARSPRHEAALSAAARRLGVRRVASPAARLATPADYPTYRLVTAVRRGLQIDQLPAALPVTPQHHIPTADEFRARFRDLPQALSATDDLADLLRSDVLPRDLILPRPLSFSGELDEHLRCQCEEGLRQRGLADDPAAVQRLHEELAIIEATHLAGYFLAVHEIARHVRQQGHTMALRGSAGNSLVCYLLHITDVNPLRFGLALDRFLHPGRVDLPDIDLDFDWKVRDAVIDHTFQRYGQAHAARICTHQLIQPRSAFRESGRLHGLSNEQISQLLLTLDRQVDELVIDATPHIAAARYLPAVSGSRRATPPLYGVPRGFPLEPERWPRLLVDAARLLGRPDHLSIHPGGIVLTPTPIEDHVPLQWAAKGVVVTQLEKEGIERIGLVKIDLLGNRALATVDEATHIAGLCSIRSIHDDSDTRELIRTGNTLGVCQLESPAMRRLLIQMQASSIDDVIQALALLRPGAAGFGVKEHFIRRKLGLDSLDGVHPRLREILPEGYGLMVYQDDALHLIQALTGLAAAPADFLRKHIAKQVPDEIPHLRAKFLGLCRRGPRPHLPPALLDELWEQLSKFNRYSFCKSHAVSYGLIAWRSAYLKAHHPLAFWTAALNNNMGSYARWVYVEAVRAAGFAVVAPCINRSAETFTAEDGKIRVGLGAISGLATELRQRLLDERTAGGAYRTLADFRQRVAPGPEALALLIRAGALDVFGLSRPVLFLQAQQKQAERALELFDAVPSPPDWQPADFDLKRRLRDQWQTLGCVLDVPLTSLLQGKKPTEGKGLPPVISCADLPRYDGRVVRVQGLVATGRTIYTVEGRPIQFVTLQDAHGLAEITLFEGQCPHVPYLTLGPYTATGLVEEQYGVHTLTARAFEPCAAETEPAV
jgi:DNA polymerase-3 subunit alpha/error-prone DNA polymerase